MFNLFKTKIKKTWGLNLTDRHLRAVEIEGTGKQWKIKKLGKVELPPGVVENGTIKQPESFKDYLNQLQKTAYPSSIRSHFVNINLAEEHAFMRTIRMPKLAPDEMEEAIQWEAESNIPLSIDKVYLSWEELPEKGGDKIPTLLAATPKTVIDKMISSLEEARLTPVTIEPDSVSLMRSILETNPESSNNPVLIVNLKEFYTQIVVFDSAVVRLSTTCETSGQDFDKSIATKFKIGIKEAEKIRKEVSWNERNDLAKQLQEVVASPLNSLIKEIGNAISFYQNDQDKDIQNIILTGEKRNKWPGFDEFLGKALGLSIKWQNGFDPDKWPAKCPYVTEGEKEEYNIGIGLALKSLESGF